MTNPSEKTMRLMLMKAGWKQKPTAMAWSWYQPDYPSALYRIRDAFDLARSERKKNANRPVVRNSC